MTCVHCELYDVITLCVCCCSENSLTDARWLSLIFRLHCCFALLFVELFTSDKGGGICFCPCSFVYLWARLPKKACMDLDETLRVTDIGTWTNWLTFEPDPDYSPVAGTWLLSPISYVLQRGILLRRENPTYRYWAAATRGFKMVLFAASRRNNFVRGKCALPSAILICTVFTDAAVSHHTVHNFDMRIAVISDHCLTPLFSSHWFKCLSLCKQNVWLKSWIWKFCHNNRQAIAMPTSVHSQETHTCSMC